MKNKRQSAVYAAIHHMPIEELARFKCWHCLDTGLCLQCCGKGILPSTDPATGKPSIHGGRVRCEYCKGQRVCQECKVEERLSA